MSHSYSYDLRKKVVDAIELDGMPRCEASQHFNNHIEHCWAWVKARVHRCKHQFDSLRDAIEHVLRLAS